jgi:hypothetical protein
MKYRKKPVVIEAIQWDGNNLTEIRNFVDEKVLLCDYPRGKHEQVELSIETLEGDHLVTKGDYIIKGVAGEFYPCKPDIFEQTYEMVGEE